MSTKFHIGAKDLRGPITAYAKRFDFLEVLVTAADAAVSAKAKARGTAPHPDETKPTLSTLRRWRKDVPPHFDFTVVAGPNLSKMKPGPELERDIGIATSAIAALRARCFIVRTAPEVTPSALWRERMGKVFARFPNDATMVVWEASGIWETGDAAVCAKKWGVTLAVDAAREPVPAGNAAYVRLRAMGETRSFGESALDRIVTSIGPRRDVFVVLETDTALVECKRLRRIAQRPSDTGAGGMSRLVRPRGGIVVRDDEQE